MTNIAERLLLLRGKAKQGDFAKELGINPNTLRSYENGRSLPNQEFLEQICVQFSVSAEWLLLGNGPMRRNDTTDGSVKAHEYGNGADLIMIPRVPARLCASTGGLETGDNVLGLYAFRADWILRKGNTKHMVLMDATGDSMAPDIRHGDIVLVDQSKTEIYGHGFYAVGVEDAIYIKEIMTLPGKLILKSINPRYNDINVPLGGEHASSVRIIGRVLWVGRELD